MPRLVLAYTLAGLALAVTACRSSPTAQRFQEWQEGALVKSSLREYHVIYSSQKGKVGYLKVKDVSEGGGPAYPWKYVYDAEWTELGFINQFGAAYMYHRYPDFEAARQNEPLRVTYLPSDSTEHNVMRMLGIDPSLDNVTFPLATMADLESAPEKIELAGPGLVPATAADAAKGEAAPQPVK